MFFILLTFAAALFIEGLGSLVSVIGISALFGANPIIIALAISLDVGKIVVVSLLYTYWKSLSKLMKTYALLAAAVTMVITSSGAAGYLSDQFQKAIQGAKEGETQVAILKEQQQRYQERKKQIDDQIANLPPKTTVNQRLRLVNGFKAEQARLDQQIQDIDKKLPDLQVSQIGTEAKAGPILAIAKAFGVPVEEAVKWVIFMIIFVFDPLAIFLIIAGNFLWARRKRGDPTTPFEPPEDMPPAPVPPKDDEDLNINNYYVDKDGTVHRPQMPDFMLEPEKPREPLYTILEPTKVEVEEIMTPDPDGARDALIEHLEKPTEVPVIETELEPPAPEPLPESGLTSPVNVEVEPIPTGRKIEREEVPHSSLHSVPSDPKTIVDAGHNVGFRKSTLVKDSE